MTDPTAQEQAPPPIEPPRYRGRNFLRGCLWTLLALFIIGVVVIASFVSWLRTPGVLLEGGTLVDASTAVYAEAHLRPDDPGILKFFRKVMEQQRALQAKMASSDPNLPEALQPILNNLPHRQAKPVDLEKILPLVVVATERETGGGEVGPLFFAVSLPKLGNRLKLADFIMSLALRWMKPNSDLRLETYGDESIYVAKAEHRSLWFALRGSDVLVAQDEAMMKDAIDRLRSPAKPPGAELPKLLARRPDKASFFMAAREGFAPEVADLIGNAIPAFGTALTPLLGDSGPVVLWASIADEKTIEGELHVLAPSAGASGEPSGYSGSVTAPFEEGEVKLALDEIQPAPGDLQAWKIRITGVSNAARHVLHQMQNLEELSASKHKAP